MKWVVRVHSADELYFHNGQGYETGPWKLDLTTGGIVDRGTGCPDRTISDRLQAAIEFALRTTTPEKALPVFVAYKSGDVPRRD